MLSRNIPLYASLSAIDKRRWKAVILSGIVLIAVIVIYFVNPANAWPIYPSAYRPLISLYCPAYWTVQGIYQLLHGHLWSAFELNPLLVVSLPYLLYSYIGYSVSTFTGCKFTPIFIKYNLILWTLKIVLGYWVLYNISFLFFS